MAYLLFPGRHIINTVFQERCLWESLRIPLDKLELVGGDTKVWVPQEKITHLIFAVTSANQEHSRYNPVPFYMRAIQLDRFAKQFKDNLGVDYSIVAIPHYDLTDKFVERILKEVGEYGQKIKIAPENTIVLCSTPALIEAYKDRGFAVLPAEYDYEQKSFIAETPVEVVKEAVAIGEAWEKDATLLAKLSKATVSLWKDFPDVFKTIEYIWNDPLLTERGSLTEQRNYSTYAFGMGHGPLLELKYSDIRDAVISGKIVDEGCADGALITRLAKDFPDSDIIGIDLASEFLARAQERQRAGEFGGTFVHFHQRNLFEDIFEPNSIDTTICNSTTHEIWSYGGQEPSVREYLKKKYIQTRPGGRLVIRDVVGPEQKDKEIYLALNGSDGSAEDIFEVFSDSKALEAHLRGLSTYARFLRFVEDFLTEMRATGKRGADTKIIYREEIVGGKKYIALRLKDAVEFMTKKDYADNWNSELNEEFTFWSFSEWKRVLADAGFTVLENPNNPKGSSRVYSNQWIIDNRFKGKVELFEKGEDGQLKALDYPVTNMVLVGEKAPE